MALLKLAAKPKNCKQTICGKSCIRSTYTCRIKEPQAKEKIKAKTKELAIGVKSKALAIGAKSKAKTKAQELISQVKSKVLAKAKAKELAVTKAKELAKALAKPKTEPKAEAKFNFDTLIGEGSYGKVFLDKDKKIVQKVLKKDTFTESEILVSKAMGEAGFSPKIYSEHTNSKKITMDLVSGKTLDQTEKNKYNLTQTKEIFKGLIFLQKKVGYYHGDIHLGNILVDGNSVKIIDYGLALKTKGGEKEAFSDFNYLRELFPMEQLRKDPEVKGIVSLMDKYGKDKWWNLSDQQKVDFRKDYRDWLDSESD